MTLLDLAPGGVYLAVRVTSDAGGLLHHRFTLTGDRGPRRSVFCGTVPRVTPGGRYPPPCPVEPGRSSARSKILTRPSARLVCRVGHATRRERGGTHRRRWCRTRSRSRFPSGGAVVPWCRGATLGRPPVNTVRPAPRSSVVHPEPQPRSPQAARRSGRHVAYPGAGAAPPVPHPFPYNVRGEPPCSCCCRRRKERPLPGVALR